MTPHSDSTPIKTHCEICNCELTKASLANRNPCSCGLILCVLCFAPPEIGDHGQVYHKKTAVEESPSSGLPVCPHCSQDIDGYNFAIDKTDVGPSIAVVMFLYCRNPKCRKLLPACFMGHEPLPPKYDDKPDSRLVKLARGGGVLTNEALARSIRNSTRNRIPNVRKVQ